MACQKVFQKKGVVCVDFGFEKSKIVFNWTVDVWGVHLKEKVLTLFENPFFSNLVKFIITVSRETKNVLMQPQIKADTVYAEYEGCGKKSATCEFWKYFARLIVGYGSRKEIRHKCFFVSSVNLNGKETVSEKVQSNVVTKCLLSFYRQI